MTTELRGMRALVTGATAGIGEAIARAFAGSGARVLVHGRDASRAAALAAEINGDVVVGDLLDPATPASLVSAARATGGLDILVNNAGFEEHAILDDLDGQTLERLMRVNFLAPVETVRLAVPLLEASGRGTVVNVTSIHESVPVAGNGGYAAAKAALAAWTRTASVELGPRRVRINNLAPGAIVTDMNRELIARVGHERFARWIPLGAPGSVDHVARAALFLAGADSAYVTGTTLTVDGGYSNHLVRYAPDPGAS
ncbi:MULTISPECIES: SDR family NAD(P)-dependent oxidoreductase [unclassified Isoptericola]|uniref:SDR family NAD(P)-dependent oxidoreductase n=1 Tax=unclassified Isoptericola TaxID=2623355 RepID=UPI003666185F